VSGSKKKITLEQRLDRWFTHKEIPDFWDPDQVYLKRWWVLRTRWFIVRIHKIMMSDSDRDLHDHPWSFWSWILKGSYIEEIWDEDDQMKKIKLRPRWSLGFRNATQLHRLTLENDDEPVWTIVVSGRSERDWGFQTDDGWLIWHEYLALQADM
jgi:hypothetical protein